MTKSFLKKKKQNPAIFTWYMLGGKIIKKKSNSKTLQKKKKWHKSLIPPFIFLRQNLDKVDLPPSTSCFHTLKCF